MIIYEPGKEDLIKVFQHSDAVCQITLSGFKCKGKTKNKYRIFVCSIFHPPDPCIENAETYTKTEKEFEKIIYETIQGFENPIKDVDHQIQFRDITTRVKNVFTKIAGDV